MNGWISENKKTISSSLIILTTVFLGFLLIYGYINGSIKNFFNEFFDIFSPITIGFVIAYLSNDTVAFIEKRLLFWIKSFSLKRLISIIISFILSITIIIVILTMLIPNLVTTFKSFWDTYIVNYDSAAKMLAYRINLVMDQIPIFDSTQRINPEGLVELIQETFPWIDNLVEGDFSAILPNGSQNVGPSGETTGESSIGFDISLFLNSDNIISVFGYALSLGSSVVNIIKNIFLGIFVAIYMLMSKERIKAYTRRLLNSFLSPAKVRATIRFGTLLNRSFGGFIEGQLLDALVVGIMTYVLFNIFKFANPLMLATIIAVTNIIPVLGPFIGGIPATFLVLLTTPEKTILCVLLIILIQQIDGNIICPHILGDKINISSLATITAIVTMGGLFGIFGMLIGVPVFAVIIHLINNYTMNALRRKGLETSLNHYYVGDVRNLQEKNASDTFDKVLKSISKVTKKLLVNKKKKNIKEK